MKQSLIITAIWLAHVSAHAEPDLDVAFKGGPDAATLAEDYRVNRYGFSGGLAGYLQRPLIDRLSLGGQIELLYAARGSEINFGGEFLGKSRQHYIDFTIEARPEARFGRVSVYLLIGGGFDFLLSANKEDASGMKQVITGDLHRVDVALIAGAGVAVHLPRQKLGPFRLDTIFLEARHDIGLIDTDAINGGYKNRTSSLMLGLSFVIGDHLEAMSDDK